MESRTVVSTGVSIKPESHSVLPLVFLSFLQASPAPIIVNTDTLDSVPYVSFEFIYFLSAAIILFCRRSIPPVDSDTLE